MLLAQNLAITYVLYFAGTLALIGYAMFSALRSQVREAAIKRESSRARR